MTLENIDLKVGRKCQLVDSDGAFVDGNVTEADVISFVNDRYKQLYLKFTNKYPWFGQYYETVDLVEDQEFYSFEDLSLDLLVPNYAGIKYTSTDSDFTKIVRRERNNLFRVNTGKDQFDKSYPYYNYARDTDGDVGITISPTPDADVTDGLYFEYIILPSDLSGSGESPNLPEGLQTVMIAYVISDVWETKRDWSNSNQAYNRALMVDKEFFEHYRPKTSDTPVKYGINKSFNPFNR